MNTTGIKHYLVMINFIILGIILCAGLWPFKLKIENKIARLVNENGILINRNGIIQEKSNEGLAALLEKSPHNNELSIEILLQPLSASNDNISTFISFYDDGNPELFMLAQWRSHLILRIRLDHSNKNNAYHEISVPDVLYPGKNVFITLSMNNAGTAVYIDADKKAFFPRYHLIPGNSSARGSHITIGNNPAISNPFFGKFYGLAIYNRILNEQEVSTHYRYWRNTDFTLLSHIHGVAALYPMNEKSGPILRNMIHDKNNLYIPENLVAIKKTILGPPWPYFWKSKTFYYDLLLNIAGFIPAGFFLMALLFLHYKKHVVKCIIITILYGSALSLFIELMQALMPLRSSDVIDLISNIAGTIIGVALFHAIHTSYWPETEKPV